MPFFQIDSQNLLYFFPQLGIEIIQPLGYVFMYGRAKTER